MRGRECPCERGRGGRCSWRSVAILLRVGGQYDTGSHVAQCWTAPDREPEIQERAVLGKVARRGVVHAEQEVRLAGLDGLWAVERQSCGLLCAVEKASVEVGTMVVMAGCYGADCWTERGG